MGLAATGLVTTSSPRGRYCDDRIGAIGHPYWLFSGGKVAVVACGHHNPSGTYGRNQGRWVWVSEHKAGEFASTNRLEVHWWGLAVGDQPNQDSLRRCWHFWMNSHGPLWDPWDD